MTATDYYGMTDQVMEYVRELAKRFGQDEHDFSMARHFAALTDAVIGRMFPLAAAARDFMKDVARVLAKENKPLPWVSPCGLPVINLYYRARYKRIKLYGRDAALNIPFRPKLAVGDTERINGVKAANSATANLVHSLDAAHLHKVTAAAAAINIVAVHDCYGSVAPDMPRLRDIIREQFVKMYQEHDPLSEVLESARRDLSERGRAKLPVLPPRGTLNIEDILRLNPITALREASNDRRKGRRRACDRWRSA